MMDNAELFRYAGELQCMKEGADRILLSGKFSAFLAGVFRSLYSEAEIVAVSSDGKALEAARAEDERLITINEDFDKYIGTGFDIVVSTLAITTLDTRELTPYLFNLHDSLLPKGNLYLSFPSTDKISPFPKKLVDAWYSMEDKIAMKRYTPEDVLRALSIIGFDIRAIEKDTNADLEDVTSIHAVKRD